MAETTFAKTFLTSLDSRPSKLSADHVEDARNFPPRPPYILPRMPKEMSSRWRPSVAGTGTGTGTSSSAPHSSGQQADNHNEKSSSGPVTVSLGSLRNPPLAMTLAAQPRATTSVLAIKQAVAARVGVPVDKIRLLRNRRPLQDSKVLADFVEDDEAAIELTVMVIGGTAAATTTTTTATATTASGKLKGLAAVEDPGFWSDLKGFLMQRVVDEVTAAELSTLFRNAWESRQAKP